MVSRLRKKKSERKVTLIFKGHFEDIDELSVYQASFGKLSPEQRLLEGWKMVEHVWSMKGRKIDELRLDRTVAALRK